jgi:hypothetical protein
MNNPGVLPSEREFSPQTVCVPATGVYIARALKGDSVPGTKAEVLALATDMGAPGGVGANFYKLAAGMQKRYGLVAAAHEEGAAASLAAVNAAYAKGPIVVGLAGNQLNLTPHWQTGSVGHAICVLYGFFPGVQLDPLAPAGYFGDAFGADEFRKFVTAAIIFTAYPDCTKAVADATATLQADITGLQARLASISKIATG